METGEERDGVDNTLQDNDLKDSDLVDKENKDQIIDGNTEAYSFGWSSYSEITNGRFAMLGFLAIILIELFSKQSFLKWAGIL